MSYPKQTCEAFDREVDSALGCEVCWISFCGGGDGECVCSNCRPDGIASSAEDKAAAQ